MLRQLKCTEDPHMAVQQQVVAPVAVDHFIPQC